MDNITLADAAAPFVLLSVVAYLAAFALLILTLLMPYFVWRIKKSVERSERLIKQAATQMGLLVTIENHLRNNISPTVNNIAENVRADFCNRYGINEPEPKPVQLDVSTNKPGPTLILG